MASAARVEFLLSIKARAEVTTAAGKAEANTMVSLTESSMGSQFTRRNIRTGIMLSLIHIL